MHQFRTAACPLHRVGLPESVLHQPHRPIMVALLVCLVFSAGGARAAEEALDLPQREYAFGQTHPETWQFVLGAGVSNGPHYAGSDTTETRAVPLISISYGRFFLGSSPVCSSPLSVGGWVIRTPQWREKPRQASDSPLLRA